MALRAVHPHITRLIALVVAAALALLAAASVPEPAAAGTACTKYGEVRAEKLRNRQARASIRCFLNRERKQRGIGRLDNDKRLQRAAQKHTEAMVKKACFSHECPGEKSLESRLRDRRLPDRRGCSAGPAGRTSPTAVSSTELRRRWSRPG